MSSDSIVKFRPFDKVETNWTCSISFDFVERTKFRSTLLPKPATLLTKNCNNVEATFDVVERIVHLVAFDNVASTVLLVWTYCLHLGVYQVINKIVSFVVCLYAVVANVTCPGDFRRVIGERSCYKVVSPTLADVRESRDYEQATRICQSYGAHLVSIESIEEQRHLATVLSTQPGWQQLTFRRRIWRYFVVEVRTYPGCSRIWYCRHRKCRSGHWRSKSQEWTLRE